MAGKGGPVAGTREICGNDERAGALPGAGSGWLAAEVAASRLGRRVVCFDVPRARPTHPGRRTLDLHNGDGFCAGAGLVMRLGQH
jgi:hypothetical protein